MKTTIAVAVALAGLIATPTWAHGPVRLKLERSEVLNATPDAVWQAIGNFCDMSWHPAVQATDCSSTELKPDETTRVLKLNPDGAATITETLTKLNTDKPEKRSYGYMISQVDPKVLPVTNYASTITVEDAGGKAKVTWKAGFYRGFPNNNPPPELNDEAATAAVTGIYDAGMAKLIETFGKAN